jgi:hypothetical protein
MLVYQRVNPSNHRKGAKFQLVWLESVQSGKVQAGCAGCLVAENQESLEKYYSTFDYHEPFSVPKNFNTPASALPN